MEFEKLRDIIVEVLNVDENEVTMESTFIDDLGACLLYTSSRSGRKLTFRISAVISFTDALNRKSCNITVHQSLLTVSYTHLICVQEAAA